MSFVESARSLLTWLATTPSADNSQPWGFALGSNTLRVHYRRPVVDVFGPTGHATCLAFGAMRQIASDYARYHGIDLSLSEIPTAELMMEVSWPAQPGLPADAGEQAPALLRHTNRFAYKRAAIASDVLERMSGLELPGSRLVFLTDGGKRRMFGEAFQRCAQARFSTPELHEWLMSSLRFTPEAVAQGDGLDIASLPLPPGGGAMMRALTPWSRMAFLNRFGLYRMFAAIEAAHVKEAPLLLAVVGDGNASFNAGGLMQQAWVALNASGVAVQPYYVATDLRTRLDAGTLPANWAAPVGEALASIESVCDVGPGERLHVVLRAGLPTRDAPRSRRLPLERLLVS